MLPKASPLVVVVVVVVALVVLMLVLVLLVLLVPVLQQRLLRAPRPVLRLRTQL